MLCVLSLALSAHVSRLNDRNAPPATRVTACTQAADSFFYGPAAQRNIRAVAEDTSADPSLREHARATANGM